MSQYVSIIRRMVKKKTFVLFLSVIFFLLAIFSGCARFRPRPMEEVGFKERAQTQVDGNVGVTVAVLSAKESKEVFGVPLARKLIQPVWLEIENNEDFPIYFLWTGLDPEYFSPMEAAYSQHHAFSKSANRKMDEHFDSMRFRNPILPGTIGAGFVFANLDEGTKVVDADLVAQDWQKSFTFFVPVPGIFTDSMKSDFLNIYSEDKILSLDEESLREALEKLPCCTTNKDGTSYGDPLNLVLIGDREDLFPAFIRRGWHPTETTHIRALWKTMKSFLFGKRYRYSPVSSLYVFGRRQDISGQKARYSVRKRNHLRMWLTPMRFEEKQVWIGQISRDVGVKFTLKTANLTTHVIDPDVDETRNGLIQDLLYSQALNKFGFVRGVGESTRSAPRTNLTGDPYYTDGLRAVLLFDRRPTAISQVQILDWEPLQTNLPQPEPSSKLRSP